MIHSEIQLSTLQMSAHTILLKVHAVFLTLKHNIIGIKMYLLLDSPILSSHNLEQHTITVFALL